MKCPLPSVNQKRGPPLLYFLNRLRQTRNGNFSFPPWRRSQKQPSELSAWIWFRIALVGGLGWGGIAFLIAPQKNSILGYIALTMLLGGLGGLLFGYRSSIPANKPPYFSFQLFATVVGILTILLSAAVFVVLFIVAYFTHSIPGLHMAAIFKVLLYIFITPIPIVIAAIGFAPFARWQMSRLSEKQFGIIGILLILLAFLMRR